MNKLLLPSILAAIVLLAGIFAFIPTEKATTVHISLSGIINDFTSLSVTTIPDDGTVSVVTTEPKLINGLVVTLATGADLTFSLQSDDDFDGIFAEAGELDIAATAGTIDVTFTNRGALQLIDPADGDGDAVDIKNDQVLLLIERFA